MFSAVTHGDVAVRLDLVNPEALLHQVAGSAQKLFELAQREGPHLEQVAGRVSHSCGETTRIPVFHKGSAIFLQFLQQGAIAT